MPRMNLEGSSSIVTGGASGIGEGAARQLAAWLAEVRISARARAVEAQLTRTPQGDYAGSVVPATGARSSIQLARRGLISWSGLNSPVASHQRAASASKALTAFATACRSPRRMATPPSSDLWFRSDELTFNTTG